MSDGRAGPVVVTGETLQQSAARCGGHCWVERRVFEVLGAWGPAVDAPVAKLALDRASQHAAWRAGEWWARLPVLAGVDRDALVSPPPGWVELLGATGTHADAGTGPAAALALATRVILPRLAVRYRRHAELVTPVADRAVRRTLDQALADLRADREDLDAALLGALGEPDGPQEAAEAVRRADGVAAAG